MQYAIGFAVGVAVTLTAAVIYVKRYTAKVIAALDRYALAGDTFAQFRARFLAVIRGEHD